MVSASSIQDRISRKELKLRDAKLTEGAASEVELSFSG